MSNWHFSENPILEEIAIGVAKNVFGKDWAETVTWAKDTGRISEGEWSMVWGRHNDGSLQIDTVRDEQYENSNPKTPARQSYRSNGKMVWRVFVINGQEQDPEPGVAAMESYYSNGAVHEREFYCRGELNNPWEGQPARTKHRYNGTIQETLQMKNGKTEDTAYGEPAVVFYDESGMAVGGHSALVPTRLSAAETEKRLSEGKKKRAEELCNDAVTVIAGKSTVNSGGEGLEVGRTK